MGGVRAESAPAGVTGDSAGDADLSTRSTERDHVMGESLPGVPEIGPPAIDDEIRRACGRRRPARAGAVSGHDPRLVMTTRRRTRGDIEERAGRDPSGGAGAPLGACAMRR